MNIMFEAECSDYEDERKHHTHTKNATTTLKQREKLGKILCGKWNE